MSDARPYAVWPDPRSRSRSRVIENHSTGVDRQSRAGLNFLVLLFSSKTYTHSACHGRRLSWLRHCSNGVRPVLEAVYYSGCCENSPWEDLILTSHAPQLVLLSLADWDLQNQISTIPVFLHSQIGAKTNLQFHACAQIGCHLLLCPLISLCFRVGPSVK